MRDRSEDIVQVAMMRVMRAAARGNTHFNATYLRKVAYSATIDEIRRLKTDREVSMEDSEGRRHDPADVVSPTPEGSSRGAQIGRGIADCMGHMIGDRRRAVTLYLQGHSAPEIARLLEWNRKRSENLIYRGLADLRACLRGKGLTP